MKKMLFMGLVIGIFSSVTMATAAVFHVTTAGGLTDALITAKGNGEDDTIYLAAGTYQGNFYYKNPEAKNLVIAGEPGTRAEDVILDGIGAGDGKGLYLDGASAGYEATIEGLTVQHGTYSGLYVRVTNGSIDLTLNNVIIQYNTTWYMGGGVYLEIDGNGAADVKIFNSIIRFNQAGVDGRYGRSGGIHADTGYGNSALNLLIVNSLIYKNEARATGGGIGIDASEVGMNNTTRAVIVNSTITGNVANVFDIPYIEDGGGGVFVTAYGGTGTLVSVDLYNTIIHGNTSGDASTGSGIGLDLYVSKTDPGSAVVNAYNCDINDVAGDLSLYHPTNVINGSPLFADSANDDYHLTKDSPCINTGTADVPSPPGLPETDLEGNSRIVGPLPDIGAYEFVGLNIKPKKGTIGTVLDITGTEFGDRRGKVSIGAAVLKIVKWTTGWIQASLTKALPAGVYDVKIESRGTEPIILENGFTSMAPVIDSVDPTSGSTNDEITLQGRFYGTKRGKVTLGGKNCRLLRWTMDPLTGESEVQFVVPRGLSSGTHELKITNGVGSDTADFNVN